MLLERVKQLESEIQFLKNEDRNLVDLVAHHLISEKDDIKRINSIVKVLADYSEIRNLDTKLSLAVRLMSKNLSQQELSRIAVNSACFRSTQTGCTTPVVIKQKVKTSTEQSTSLKTIPEDWRVGSEKYLAEEERLIKILLK